MEPTSDEQRLYRLALILTILFSAGSLIISIVNLYADFLSPRATGAMWFGIFFWLLIFFGYRADLKERTWTREEERQAGAPSPGESDEPPSAR